MEYNSQIELFYSLKPAFLVKMRLLGKDLKYIKIEDIWNYLKISKWRYDHGLTISEMVDDIINVNGYDIDNYLKEKISQEEKILYLDEE